MISGDKHILFASPWWHEDIVNGVLHHAARRGWHVDLQTCLSGKLPATWQGDGIITQFGVDLDELQQLIAASACPAVSLNSNYPRIAMPRVCANDRLAGQLAAQHLLDRSFKSFAFYSHGSSPDTTQLRCDAFADTLSEQGYETHKLIWQQSDINAMRSWNERQAWLRTQVVELPKPIGVFCVNDQAGAELIEACLHEAIAIPDQVAVLGMLNMAMFRHCTSVALSSIVLDFNRITQAACDLLAHMMEGEQAPVKRILFAPTGIAVRQSTDTFAAHSPRVARAVRFMFDHYAEELDVDAIVRVVGGSRAGLYKAFGRDFNQSPGAVLTRIRIDKAKRMLVETDARIYTIAEVCGFGKPVNLHRCFNQHVGISPNAYRKHKAATARR